MINSDINSGGIYRAFILSDNNDIRLYIPGLNSGGDAEVPVNNDGSLNNEVFQKCKNILPKPLWCLPNIEAKQHTSAHPCWVVFENGDAKRPIIMGFLGKGIQYSAGSTNTGVNDIGDGSSTEIDASDIPITLSSSGWVWPAPNNKYITSGYGKRICPYHGEEFHEGIDISGNTGSPILAANDGSVILSSANKSSSYGYHIKLPTSK